MSITTRRSQLVVHVADLDENTWITRPGSRGNIWITIVGTTGQGSSGKQWISVDSTH